LSVFECKFSIALYCIVNKQYTDTRGLKTARVKVSCHALYHDECISVGLQHAMQKNLTCGF